MSEAPRTKGWPSLREPQRNILPEPGRRWPFLLLLAAALSVQPGLVADAVLHRYFSPLAAPGGDGSRPEKAVRFEENDFARFVQGLPESGRTAVFLHFLPGIHEGVVIQVGGSIARPHRGGVPVPGWSIGDLSLHIVGHGAHPADTVLVFPANRYGGSSPNGFSESGMVSVGDSTPEARSYTAFTSVDGGRRTQAEKVVVENLTLDGNWRSQWANGNPASPLAYKLYGLHVIAARGRFRDLILRDHGSQGLVCRSRFDNPAGMENFPILVQAVDDGQEPTLDADQAPGERLRQGRPWLVERCEIHGFNNSRAGYNTAIAMNVVTHDPRRPEEAAYVHHQPPLSILGDVTRRFALVRNNQVRGGAYAFGQAGPGYCTGSTFAGNVTVGAAGGYNADTHAVLAADLTNNVFLDARVGVRQVTSGFRTPISINFHRIKGNLLRLVPRSSYRAYEDFRTHFEIQDGSFWVTRFSDASLVLGENVPGAASAWLIDGCNLGSSLEENFVTTRWQPRPWEGGVDSSKGRFQVVNCLRPTDLAVPRETGTQLRPASQDVLVGGNRLSRVADGFVDGRLLGAEGRYPRFEADTPSTGYLLVPLDPLPVAQTFPTPAGLPMHMGTTERLLLFLSKAPQTYEWRRPTGPGTTEYEVLRKEFQDEPTLAAVGEVLIPDLRIETGPTSARLRGKVRLVRHQLPGSRIGNSALSDPGPATRTVFVSEPQGIRILFSGIHSGVLTRITQPDGSCDFEVPLPEGTPAGILKAEVYWNERPATGGAVSLWEDSADGTVRGDPNRYRYWCAVSSGVAVHREAVEISVTPDVANDRNPSNVPQRPVVTLRRATGATLREPLEVQLQLPEVRRGRYRTLPETGREVYETVTAQATYGADFRLLQGSTALVPSNPDGLPRFRVTLPAGVASTQLVLVPTYDDLTEEEVVAIRVLPGEGYGAGVASEVLVHVYDGPEFALRELSDSRAANGATVGRGINSDPSPVIAGNLFNYAPRGGVWTHPNLSGGFLEVQSTDPSGYAHEAFAVTDSVAGRYLLAGSRWSGSRRIPWAGVPGAPSVLPTLTGGLGGEALAITQGSDASALAVGWSERRIGSANVPRPVAWRRSASGIWSIDDLGSLQPTDPGSEGVATTVDGGRAIGGWSRGVAETLGSTNVLGFHVTEGRARMDREKDVRLPIGVPSLNRLPSAANSAVHGIGRETTAVGVSFLSYRGITNAVVWRSGVLAGEPLFTPSSSSGNTVSSDALLIVPPEFPLPNWKNRPLGRVWTNSPTTAVAVIWPLDSKTPVPLDDPHLTLGAPGWRLTRPLGASSSGSIVGEGLLNGIGRGFVLVSRK